MTKQYSKAPTREAIGIGLELIVPERIVVTGHELLAKRSVSRCKTQNVSKYRSSIQQSLAKVSSGLEQAFGCQVGQRCQLHNHQ